MKPHLPTAAPNRSLLAHGFTIKQMGELVRAGPATAQSERIVAGRRTVEVVRTISALVTSVDVVTTNFALEDARAPAGYPS